MIQTVTKAIAPAIPTGIKVLKSTLTIPQPCQTGIGWNQLPRNIISKAALLGLSAWLNDILTKLKAVKGSHTSNQTHHIIARSAWSSCGSVRHDFYLDDAREVVRAHFGTVDNYYNYAFINNTLHRRIHTKLYYQSIWLNFSKVYAIKNDVNKGIVRNRLLNYKIVLEGISYLGV